MFSKKVFNIVFISAIVVATSISTLAILDATGVVNITSKKTYNVEFRNYDDSYLWDVDVVYGQEVTYEGPKPQKVLNDGFEYTFASWSKNLDTLTGESVVYAQYMRNLQKFTVTFVNYDYTPLYTTQVQYGGTASYVGAAPTRQTDGENVYSFKGWDKSLVNIREDTTFIAQFDSKKADKIVTFKNYDGTVLYKDAVEFGGDAIYRGLEPIKPKDDDYNYSFDTWDHTLLNVTQNFITTALFKATPLEFDVTFLNYDSSELYVDRVEKGGNAQYIGPTPLRECDDPGYVYVFTGWSKELQNIQEDTIVTAEFEKKREDLTVIFKNYDDTVLDVQTCNYGGRVFYSKEEPKREPDQMYTYTFMGWDRNIDYVTETMSVYPVYQKELRKYQCKFFNENGAFLYLTEATYGSPAVYLGETPYKEGDFFNKWKFVGWDNDTECVVEDTVFTAQFEINDEGGGGNEKLYEVYFLDYDGQVIDADLVKEGETAYCHLDDFNQSERYFEEFNRFFEFDGFEKAYTWNKLAYVYDVNQNMTLYANYRNDNYCLVTYLDYFDQIIYQEVIERYSSSSYKGPAYDFLDTENGFLGWDQDLNWIYSCLYVRPIREDL